MKKSYEQFLAVDVVVPTYIEEAIFKGIRAPIKAFLGALFRKSQPPENSLHYMQIYCRILGLLPTASSSFRYKFFNFIIMLFLGIFIATNTCDLKEAVYDVVSFGEDLVILLGVYLIYFKVIHCRVNLPEIEDIVQQFNKLHKTMAYRGGVVNKEILNWQRIHFLWEITSFLSYYALALFLTASICLQPFLSQSAFHLPYRTKFPFDLHNPDKHPYAHHLIFAFQSFCTHHNLISVLVIDNVGVHVISQISLNLKIVCIRLRELKAGEVEVYLGDIVKLHQTVISLSDRVNKCYNMSYFLQMGASTFIICLTAFETLLAKDEPLVALKFIVYMATAFMQLLYYSLMGNFVYVDSLAVGEAAYEVEDWHLVSKKTKRDLMFIAQRAQKPLLFRPKPLLPFNFETFTTILSTSYSYFTLLKTMID